MSNVTDESFDSDISTGYVFVECVAPWCSQCRSVEPMVKDAEKKYSLQILTLDCETCPKTTSRLRVMSLPTMILFKDGEEVNRAYSFGILEFLEQNKDKK